MTNFVSIHDADHNFLDGLVDIPFNLLSTSFSAINKAYIEISLLIPITRIDRPSLLGFLYQEFNGKRSKPYPIISQQQSITLDFSNCDNFIFVPTNRLIDDYGLKLYVANDSSDNGSSQSVDLSTYVTESELATVLNDYALAVSIPYAHNHLISEITGLNDVLDDHEQRIAAIELAQPSSFSTANLIVVTANRSLDINSDYFIDVSGLALTLPSDPSLGNFVRIYNNNFDTRVNHGNANQKIKNNTTDTLIGIDNGLILKPYSSIELVYVGFDLWISVVKIRQVNNFNVPELEAIATQKTYTPLALQTYTFQSGQGLAQINDGNPNTGVMKTGGTANTGLIISATFAQSTQLNSIRIHSGQFNGDFNMPTTVKVYKGSGAILDNLIATFNSIDNPNNAVHTLTNLVSDTVFTFEFLPISGDISIRELTLFGKSVSGGEIVVS